MKKIFILLGFLVFAASAFSQQHRNCGTNAYLKYQHSQDSSLVHQMEIEEASIQNWIKNNSLNPQKAVIRIPVVIHILYQLNYQNISGAQVLSQLDILNEDYRRRNLDTSDTPNLFKSVAADAEIEFCLAHVSPTGTWTDGITRTYTTKSVFDLSQDDAKFTAQGGHDAWDRDNYLNIWVVPSIKDGPETGILGYAQFPGGYAPTDGVVISHVYFGNTGTAVSPFDKGRTATHEIGHWLGLYHIWGDDNGYCTGTDYVDDTPNQAGYSYSCPTFPQPSCGNTSDMFMNYMDYSDDACMNIFTEGQKARMLAVLNGSRASIKSSTKCLVVSIDDPSKPDNLKIFPNPTSGEVNLDLDQLNIESNYTVNLYNLLGQLVYTQECKKEMKHLTINISDAPNGIYMLYVDSEQFNFVKKIQILK